MSGYINANSNLNADDFLSLFKKLYSFIKDIFTKNQASKDLSFDNLVEIYSNDKEFLKYLKFIKTSLDDIGELIEDIDFPYYEYDNFMSIKKMITYIADDVSRYIKYSSLILPLLTAFSNLIEHQFDSDYENIYEKFDMFLDEQEDFFYTEIFEYTHEYDDLIDKVTNILG